MASKKQHNLPSSMHYIKRNKPFSGVVFIGDPHVWSHKPGRRRDIDYLGTILNKIIWIAEFCNEHNMLPIVLGDLLDDSQDNDLVMISRLVAALQHFNTKPLVLVGNHDISEKTLTPGTVLHLLHNTGQIDAMMKNAPHAIIEVEHNGVLKKVLIGGTPYGEKIPHSLEQWSGRIEETNHDAIKQALEVDEVIWITHDDLAFDSSYPNSVALHPIHGVDLCINGHMHRTQKPIRKGPTSWYNPGNINRITIDLIDQIPQIWTYYPDATDTDISAEGLPIRALKGVTIPHVSGPDILSLEGRISAAEQMATERTHQQPENEGLLSQFVQQIKKDNSVAKSDDGVFLAGVIEEELNAINPPEHIKAIISRLFEQALIEHRGQK